MAVAAAPPRTKLFRPNETQKKEAANIYRWLSRKWNITVDPSVDTKIREAFQHWAEGKPYVHQPADLITSIRHYVADPSTSRRLINAISGW